MDIIPEINQQKCYQFYIPSPWKTHTHTHTAEMVCTLLM